MIKELKGVIDYRYQYHLDSHRFMTLISPDESCILEDAKTKMSQRPLRQVSINKDDIIISHATALMTGLNHVEIDISTKESYRQKGFAYRVSKTLIYDLIKQGFTPEWNCWQIKNASQKLAEKLGFTLEKVIPAYVWIDAFKPYN